MSPEQRYSVKFCVLMAWIYECHSTFKKDPTRDAVDDPRAGRPNSASGKADEIGTLLRGNGLFQSKRLLHQNKTSHGINEDKHASRSTETQITSPKLLVDDNLTLKHPIDSILNAHFLDDLPCEVGFQQEYEVDFPTEKTASPKIPHVIHQIWITTSENMTTSSHQMVPAQFIDNMKTFRKFNPSWEYMFWSYANGRSLVERFYPNVLDYFDKAPESVTKSDLL
ncbi:hypothetical protein MAR_027953, partial [Mya arenaria]